MVKLRARYSDSEDSDRIIFSLGADINGFLDRNTASHNRVRDGKYSRLVGRGPGQRMVSIGYCLDTPTENIHEIEISDPKNEEVLKAELMAIYRQHHFIFE